MTSGRSPCSEAVSKDVPFRRTACGIGSMNGSTGARKPIFGVRGRHVGEGVDEQGGVIGLEAEGGPSVPLDMHGFSVVV